MSSWASTACKPSHLMSGGNMERLPFSDKKPEDTILVPTTVLPTPTPSPLTPHRNAGKTLPDGRVLNAKGRTPLPNGPVPGLTRARVLQQIVHDTYRELGGDSMCKGLVRIHGSADQLHQYMRAKLLPGTDGVLLREVRDQLDVFWDLKGLPKLTEGYLKTGKPGSLMDTASIDTVAIERAANEKLKPFIEKAATEMLGAFIDKDAAGKAATEKAAAKKTAHEKDAIKKLNAVMKKVVAEKAAAEEAAAKKAATEKADVEKADVEMYDIEKAIVADDSSDGDKV